MIEQLYAVLGVGPDGIEGIVSYIDPTDNVMKPLVGSAKRIDEMKTIARALQNASGATLQLVVFSQRENLELVSAG
mgnify:CR=1 FL=1|jgi:hypothetical protein